MDIFKSSQSNQCVISLHGKCAGDQDAAQLGEALTEAASYGVPTAWVHCQHLAQIDYKGLQVLLKHIPRLEAAGTTLVVCGLQPKVQESFESTGMTGVVTVLPANAYTGPLPARR
ncbi:STAS domain-containing protein [Hymenobacter sp. BT175]|uniref:STAS domain-containing protein n=1 Tax=Hymenobacter translucens TaxID=2886507 RepID=UPI001D0F2E37|nr:STAS domain-containing protein [Hymenobacter translucens]MCC2547306.1 STAS domain-containing protein [Hymenobacter translucens]